MGRCKGVVAAAQKLGFFVFRHIFCRRALAFVVDAIGCHRCGERFYIYAHNGFLSIVFGLDIDIVGISGNESELLMDGVVELKHQFVERAEMFEVIGQSAHIAFVAHADI